MLVNLDIQINNTRVMTDLLILLFRFFFTHPNGGSNNERGLDSGDREFVQARKLSNIICDNIPDGLRYKQRKKTNKCRNSSKNCHFYIFFKQAPPGHGSDRMPPKCTANASSDTFGSCRSQKAYFILHYAF